MKKLPIDFSMGLRRIRNGITNMQIHCHCGRMIPIKPEWVGRGKAVKCPDCSRLNEVPAATEAHLSIRDVPQVSVSPPSLPRTVIALESYSLGIILFYLLSAWIVLSVPGALVSVFFPIVTTAIFGGIAFDLIRAKRMALSSGEASALGGIITFVAWNPQEGVLFLKDKQVGPVDNNPHDGGGVMMLLPWLGEELAFRILLEHHSTKFADEQVLTREYVPLSVKGSIDWRIVDLQKFYLFMSRSVHEVDDGGQHRVMHGHSAFGTRNSSRIYDAKVGVAEERLRQTAAELTRAEVFQTRTGLLVADKIAEGLPESIQALISPDSYNNAADGLAEGIRKRIQTRFVDYGIVAESVLLEEVQIPEEIRKKAILACQTAYDPLMAQRASSARKLALDADVYGKREELKSQVDILGKDAIARKEVLGSIQPFALGGQFAGLVDFLTHLFEDKRVVGESETTQSQPAVPGASAKQKPLGKKSEGSMENNVTGPVEFNEWTGDESESDPN